MNFNLRFILSLLLLLATARLGRAQPLALAPGFGPNMVLQRSPNTLLRGTGAPGKKLQFRFKVETKGFFGSSWEFVDTNWTTIVDRLGNWRVSVDLAAAEFQQPGPWILRVADVKDKKTSLECSNILMGNVIVLAGWQGQGVPAEAKDYNINVFGLDARIVHFLDCTTADAPGPGINWTHWPENAQDLKKYSTLVLNLAHELAKSNYNNPTNRYLGIILVPQPVLLADIYRDQPAGLFSTDTYGWEWLTREADNAKKDRFVQLVHDKRSNTVENRTPVKDYDPAFKRMAQDFDPAKPPLSWFTFSTAIYSDSGPR